jgi:FtsP/CotA-like multicopper oxidase with cupredoxin domain
MSDRIVRLDRREFLAGLGAGAIASNLPGIASAQGRSRLLLQASAARLALGSGESPIWSLQGLPPPSAPRLRRGDELDIAFENELPVATVLNWHGLDGLRAAEPLTARQPVAPGGKENLTISLRQAGTFLCDLRLLGDGQALPSPAQPLIVAESEPVAVDRDEVFLIEDWRLRPDGTPIAPGFDPKDTPPVYTVNGQIMPDIPARTHERIRIRFINACQRAVVAVKIDMPEVRVMALDGEPAEPFPARNGAIVLAPGGRADTFIDVSTTTGSSTPILLHDGGEARPIGRLVVSGEFPLRKQGLPPALPLPPNGPPARIDLKGALRFDLTLGGPAQTDWVTPAKFATSAAPAFRAKSGRTVVLALSNRGGTPMVFHLHGHHFRLLDRLDDGWKTFWLDTLAIDSGQTQRVAFQASHSGAWLMEATATHWVAPRLLRWYSVN